MTVAEMGSLFDILQDKPDSLYFSSEEKTALLNSAQNDFVNDVIGDFFFPNGRSQASPRVSSAIEATSTQSRILRPLMFFDLAVTSDASGYITDAVINSALQARSGDTKNHMFVTALALSTGVPVKWTPHNDWYALMDNSFTAATTTNPRYVEESGRILVNPTGVVNYLISVIKEPTEMLLDEATPANNIESELPTAAHEHIVSIALNKAGIASREQVLLLLSQQKDTNKMFLA